MGHPFSGTHPDELLHLKFYARKLLYFVRSHGLQKFWSDFKDKEPSNPSDGNYLEGLVRNSIVLYMGVQGMVADVFIWFSGPLCPVVPVRRSHRPWDGGGRRGKHCFEGSGEPSPQASNAQYFQLGQDWSGLQEQEAYSLFSSNGTFPVPGRQAYAGKINLDAHFVALLAESA